MTLPSDDPKLTKLRILYERSVRELEWAMLEVEPFKNKKEAAWAAYRDYVFSLGLCPNCEKKKEECKCVALAGMAVSYDEFEKHENSQCWPVLHRGDDPSAYKAGSDYKYFGFEPWKKK